jgi:hypothetical protein
MTDRLTISVTFDPARGYVATGADGLTVTALSLNVLRRRIVERLGKDARLQLDKRARAERNLRRSGGASRAADAWPR